MSQSRNPDNMKPLIPTLLLTLVLVPAARAQEGMAIEPFFDDGIKHRPGAEVTAVSVTGKQLQNSNLSIYRSVSVTGDPSLTQDMERAVTRDGAKAESREVSLKDGHLYFGFYTLIPQGKEYSYMFYLNSTLTGGSKTTLIYMQGKAEPYEIRNMIKR